jgi:hypothetical protein
MPYNNAYNQKIAQVLKNMTDSFIANQKKNNEYFNTYGMDISGMNKTASASKVGSGAFDLNSDVEYDIDQGTRIKIGNAHKNPVSGMDDMIGGSGFGAGTFMDTGYSSTLGASSKKTGAGTCKGSKKYIKGGNINSLKLTRKIGGNINPRKIGGKLIPKTEMPSSSMAGGTILGIPQNKVGINIEPKNKKKTGAGMSGGKKINKSKNIKDRSVLVKKIMEEKGLSMINASKYIKEHSLY